MAKTETWYDSQATAAKLISYAALLVLLGSIGWAAYSAINSLEFQRVEGDVITVLAGIAVSAFLYGVSAIIDLLIVQCEALRNRR
jgi:drug/metabolite transporter (DMT)-like permease